MKFDSYCALMINVAIILWLCSIYTAPVSMNGLRYSKHTLIRTNGWRTSRWSLAHKAPQKNTYSYIIMERWKKNLINWQLNSLAQIISRALAESLSSLLSSPQHGWVVWSCQLGYEFNAVSGENLPVVVGGSFWWRNLICVLHVSRPQQSICGGSWLCSSPVKACS